MAARATRSASRKARLTEAVATGPLGALSHDELGVIFDGLADPLHPVVAVSLSSTCLGLRTPLGKALEVLKQRHERAVALCRKMGTSCAELRDKVILDWWQDFFSASAMSPVTKFTPGRAKLNTDDMAALGMILRTNGLPCLRTLRLDNNDFGDAAMTALFHGLGSGVSLSLIHISLAFNHFGPAGAESLADALRRGALPKLASLAIGGNVIGTQGMVALAKPLRQLHELVELRVYNCEIGDEGVASLVANLGKDEFKTLSFLDLDQNGLTDKGCATLASALDDEAMPNLMFMLALDEDEAAMALLSESARRREIDMDP